MQKVCAIGFEPNPTHRKRLRQLETAYKQCGWKVKIFTDTAVSDHEGITTFYTDDVEPKNEWGASIVQDNLNLVRSVESVKLLHLSKYVNEIIGSRKAVVMKMDIEGAEIEVITDLILSGSFQYVDSLHVEFHDWLAGSEKRRNKSETSSVTLNSLARLSNKFVIQEIDNEKFGTTDFPLPQCKTSI